MLGLEEVESDVADGGIGGLGDGGGGLDVVGLGGGHLEKVSRRAGRLFWE
jgi:hypothetical protein